VDNYPRKKGIGGTMGISLYQQPLKKKKKNKIRHSNNYTAYAQTRKCASYGLIQMLYTTAQEQGYNEGESIESSSAPEKLNDELVAMPLYKTFTLANLCLEFNVENPTEIPICNWPKGWEQTWKDSWKKYNKRSTYGSDVFNNSKQFYPQAE
jgi:hypothetical protein